MTIDITEEEQELLAELIESAEREAIQGLDHADIRAFKDLLRKKLNLLDLLKDKVSQPGKRVEIQTSDKREKAA